MQLLEDDLEAIRASRAFAGLGEASGVSLGVVVPDALKWAEVRANAD
jgi:hypothetical protein